MIKFKYRYCKVHMAKYLSGDLSDLTRRRIARFISECQDCYEEYLRQRELTEHLQRSLPTFGRPDEARLDSIWHSLQTELSPAHAGAGAPITGREPNSSAAGYSLLILALGMSLLLPLMIGLQASISAVELPPRPHAVDIAMTPTTRPLVRIGGIAVSTQSRISYRQHMLQNTPLPSTFQ